MDTEYRFVNDPGHGWIEVPMADLVELGIQKKISKFSYAVRDKAFLEEDFDAQYFMFHAKKAGWNVKLVDTYVPSFPNYPAYCLGTEYNSAVQAKEMHGWRGNH